MEQTLKEFDKVLADAQEIKEKGNFIPDCSTKEGYQASKDFVLKVTTPARTALTKAHKDAKAFFLEGGRKVDSKKNELMNLLLEIEKPHKDAYKAVDDEKKRLKAEAEARIQNGFDTLNGYLSQALNASSKDIESLIEDAGSFDMDESVFGKQLPSIIELQSKVISQLTDALSQRLQHEELEKQRLELERKQAEIEAKERADREQKEKEEQERKIAEQRELARQQAEQQAKIDAENARIKAEEEKQRIIEQAEKDKQAAIEAERLRVKQEQQKLALAEERKLAEEKARAEDLEHRKIINNDALCDLTAHNIDMETAMLFIKLVASNKVSHITINY